MSHNRNSKHNWDQSAHTHRMGIDAVEKLPEHEHVLSEELVEEEPVEKNDLPMPSHTHNQDKYNKFRPMTGKKREKVRPPRVTLEEAAFSYIADGKIEAGFSEEEVKGAAQDILEGRFYGD